MNSVIDPGARGVSALLRFAVGVALVGAVVGMLGTGPLHRVAAGVTLGVVVVVPFLRVLLLARHWARLGDRRFAVAAFAVVAVAGCGAVVALF